MRLLICLCPLVFQWPVGGQVAMHSGSGPHSQIVGQIDGAINAQAIPDVVAYRHFFGVLATYRERNPASEEARRRSYLKFHFGAGCGPNRGTNTLTDQQMSKIFAVADDMTRALEHISATPSLSPDELRQRQDDAVTRAVQSLPVVVDNDAAEKIRTHVLQHVKAHVKITTVRILTSH